ncbi:hypothetical protein [Aeromonas veronii]|uniref:hypothetical protein n=1 Tax=Aeromonas veronii TaxID=654 RepID=UPI001F0A5FCA|nr:hypothetical protein [Aeromonas veronii]
MLVIAIVMLAIMLVFVIAMLFPDVIASGADAPSATAPIRTFLVSIFWQPLNARQAANPITIKECFISRILSIIK